MGYIRDIRRRLKVSRLIKVQYVIAYDVRFNINAYANFIFSDGYVYCYLVEGDVRHSSAYKHYDDFRVHITYKIAPYTTLPINFEFSNCVTQL